MCSPCARREDRAVVAAPEMPDEFWAAPQLAAAFNQRRFGQVIRAYRAVRGSNVTQAHVASWLRISQVQVSRIERGQSAVNDLEKLDRWARALRIPPRCLWFPVSAQPSDAYTDATKTPSLHASVGAEGDDVRRRQFLKTAGVGVSLLASGVVTAGSTRSIGSPEVETVREMTQTFRRLDNKFGGGHSRSAATTFLASTVEPLIRDGRCKTTVRADLFSATAELHQLIGWMAYDTGQAETGRKHLRHSLRLCQEVGNDALAAEMLAGMSHHAAFSGAAEAAVDLALAAGQTAKRTGLALLRAEAAVMEAHGLAIQGDKPGCMAALRKAEQAFTAHNGQEVPPWLGYLDGAYLAAKFGHTFRDLGRSKDAEQFARRSLEMSEGYERGRMFNTALLASTLADQGRVDEACATAAIAVDMTETVRSVRTVAYLADVARRLAAYRDSVEVRVLYGKLVKAGVPIPDPQ
jgi:transcriptional regulator with XRE-family HTH domain